MVEPYRPALRLNPFAEISASNRSNRDRLFLQKPVGQRLDEAA